MIWETQQLNLAKIYAAFADKVKYSWCGNECCGINGMKLSIHVEFTLQDISNSDSEDCDEEPVTKIMSQFIFNF